MLFFAYLFHYCNLPYANFWLYFSQKYLWNVLKNRSNKIHTNEIRIRQGLPVYESSTNPYEIILLYCLCYVEKNPNIFCLSVLPSCGATVTQNLTYLVQDVTSNPTSKVCAYTLCPVSESVNRIRLDFTVCNYFPIFLSTEYLVKYQIIDLGHDIFHYV